MNEPIICPVCYHDETIAAYHTNRDPDHTNPVKMHWRHAQGAGGQTVTAWSGGYWVCLVCDIRLPTAHAHTLISAVRSAPTVKRF